VKNFLNVVDHEVSSLILYFLVLALNSFSFAVILLYSLGVPG